MSHGSPTHGQYNNMQGTTLYSLENLEDFSRGLQHEYRVHDRLIQSVLHAGSVLSEADKETSRPWYLSWSDLFETEFRETKRFNMCILDLDTDSPAHHEIMAGLLESRLTPDVKHTLHGGIRPDGKVWVIHIFCYDLPMKRLNPLTLSIILLESILVQLLTRGSTKNQDWGCFEVTHEPTRIENSRMPDYQRTMEVLQALIHRILEKCSENTIHFIFTGIRCTKLNPRRLYQLAGFVIDMARLVRDVLSIQDDRMVKCIFCGDGLLDFTYLFDSLEQHKKRLEEGSEEDKKEIEDILEKTLMLDWNGYHEVWIEQDLVNHLTGPDEERERQVQEFHNSHPDNEYGLGNDFEAC